MKPTVSFRLTAASNRVTVSVTEYLLGLVIMPSSAACAVAAPVHIASESAKLAWAHFLKLIGIPNMLVSSDRTQRPARDDDWALVYGEPSPRLLISKRHRRVQSVSENPLRPFRLGRHHRRSCPPPKRTHRPIGALNN